MDSSTTTTEEAVLETVEELAARWHRHAATDDLFQQGMCAGWAQAIALSLRRPHREVLAALRSGSL